MTTVLERARAFALIAEHLDDDERKSTAADIARDLKSPRATGTPRGGAPEPAAHRDVAASDPVVDFLAARGFEPGRDLVWAAGVMALQIKKARRAGDNSPISETFLGSVFDNSEVLCAWRT